MQRPPRHLLFFPMVLPLAELVPWLLSLIAAIAGLSSFFKGAFWRRWRRAFMALAAAAALGAAALYVAHAHPFSAPTRPVPSERHPRAQSFAPGDGAAVSAGKSFYKRWQVTTPAQILSTPVIGAGAILYGTYQGTVESHDLRNGARLWSLPLDDFVFALTLADGARLYVSQGLHETARADLSAVDARTGRVLWQRNFAGHLEERLAWDETKETLYLGTGPGGLWALAAANGDVLWHAPLGHIDSHPLYDAGVLYVPAQEKTAPLTTFFALDAKTGKTIWRREGLPGQPWGSPLLNAARDRILTTTGRGQIGVSAQTDWGWAMALDRGGRLIWQTALPGMPIQPASYLADDDMLFVTSKTGDVAALDAGSGKYVWTARTGKDIRATASLFRAGGRWMLAVASADGLLSVLEAHTGRSLITITITKDGTSSPVIADGVLYVGAAYTLSAFAGLDALAQRE